MSKGNGAKGRKSTTTNPSGAPYAAGTFTRKGATSERIEKVGASYDLRVHVPRSQVWQGSRGGQKGKTHLHVRAPFNYGRIHRSPGYALCGRSGWFERSPEYDAEREDLCPRCVEIAERVHV